MTPDDWLTTTDVHRLELALFHPKLEGEERKWLLFGVACCRRIWDLIPELHCRKALEAAEKFAQGALTRQKYDLAIDLMEYAWERSDLPLLKENAVAAAANAVFNLVNGAHPDDVSSLAAEALSYTVSARKRPSAVSKERAAQADLLRDIFGHPSRLHAFFGRRFRPLIVDPNWLSRNKGAADKLARTMYQERHFGDMPLLGDALENAGCSDNTILEHCRGPGEHVSGCWLVDVLLGREPDGEWELEEDDE